MRGALSVVVASVVLGCFVDSQPGSGAGTEDAPTSTSTMSTSGSTAMTDDATVAMVTTDDPAGGSVTASDGSGGTTAGEFGPFGSAISWDGGCGEEVSPAGGLVFGGAAFTVEMWIQISSATMDGWQTVVSRGGSAPGAPAGWTIELAKEDDEHYSFSMCGGDPPQSGYNCVVSDDLLTVGERYHVAAVRTPPGSRCLAGMAGCARLYVAAYDSPHMLTEGELGFDWAEAAPLRLASTSSDCSMLAGDVVIDELRIWASALDAMQLDDGKDKVAECEDPDLAAYYDFDTAEGNALVDCTGKAPIIAAIPDYALADSPFDD